MGAGGSGREERGGPISRAVMPGLDPRAPPPCPPRRQTQPLVSVVLQGTEGRWKGDLPHRLVTIIIGPISQGFVRTQGVNRNKALRKWPSMEKVFRSLYFIITSTLQSEYYYSQFIEKETEAGKFSRRISSRRNTSHNQLREEDFVSFSHRKGPGRVPGN